MLKVSDNGRFLVYHDGRPFFYLGDTAWELFHRLNREQSDLYLANRAEKGFTVIQAVVLAELDGLGTPNAYGDLPLIDRDIERPNEAYFRHVDYIVDKAASLGLYIGMLPTWGDKVGLAPPKPIREHNARRYGRFLGRRYADKPIIWILGGDRDAEGVVEIWNELAGGLEEGDDGRNLMTFHPGSTRHSSTWFHHVDWLDFNMVQSGHAIDNANFLLIQREYNHLPPKPCMDGEPTYEDVPGDKPADRTVNSFHVRRNAYWSVFAGSHGHTYGDHPIWQMYEPPRKPLWEVRTAWHQALDIPGAFQMRHLKALMLSRPYLPRIPDQRVLLSGSSEGLDRVQVTRDGAIRQSDATYMMAYFPQHRRVQIDVGKISAGRLCGWWFNPRDGRAEHHWEFPNGGVMEFQPPTQVEGEDWVLVVDDAIREYPPPGGSVG